MRILTKIFCETCKFLAQYICQVEGERNVHALCKDCYKDWKDKEINLKILIVF